jgi:K+-sensing histidine kinase KdpD
VKRPVDAKSDSVQGQDVFYIYSNPAVGKTVRSIAFNPRHTAAQIVRSGRETIFVNTFPINDYSGSPSVVVATILDLTEAFADVLRSVLIKGTVAFLLLSVLTFVAIFKFRDLRERFSRAISQQRLELEEKAAFCEAAAEKLKDVDLLKRGFFTNLIAAINEPLKAVAGTLQTVSQSMEGNRADPSNSPDGAAYQRNERLQFALSETTRLSALINDYQQIELFRQKLVSSESSLLSMSAVVARTLTEDLALVQRLPQLRISSDVPERLPQIRVDEDLMRRALSAFVNYAARGAGQGKIAIQGSVNSQGWLKLSITGSAYELAGAPTDSVLDESRQFLSRLATEQGAIEAADTLIPIVLARMIVEFYGGRVDASPADTANPGFVVLLPAAV